MIFLNAVHRIVFGWPALDHMRRTYRKRENTNRWTKEIFMDFLIFLGFCWKFSEGVPVAAVWPDFPSFSEISLLPWFDQTLRSQHDKTACENLLTENCAHSTKSRKKMFLLCIQIFYFYALLYFFLLFFRSRFWRGFWSWPWWLSGVLPRRPTSCSPKNCFVWCFLSFPETFPKIPATPRQPSSQVLSLFPPPSMLFQDESSLWNNSPLLPVGIDEGKIAMHITEKLTRNPFE